LAESPSADHPYELEAKFTLQDPRQVQRLCTQPALGRDFTLGPVQTVTHLDLFLDAADFTLLRHGSALRLRHTPGGLRVTVKHLPVDAGSPVHKRVEVEEPIGDVTDPLAWTAWPAVVRAQVAEHLPGAEALQIHSAVRQMRHKRLVSGRDGIPVAELSIDEVQIYTVDGLAEAISDPPTLSTALADQSPLSTFTEVEIELLPGQPEALIEPLTRPLLKWRGLRPGTRSKLERAVEMVHQQLLVEGAPVAAWTPTLPIADGCRLVCRQQLSKLLLNEAHVRQDDKRAYLHHMRVAVRRIRTALLLFGDFLRRKRTRAFQAVLRTTGKRLGAVRDLDVALKKLAKRADSADSADLRALADAWRVERKQAFAALIEWLDSDEYRDFLVAFGRFCATAGQGARRFHKDKRRSPTPQQVRHVLPTIIVQGFARVRAFETHIAARGTLSVKQLHQLRIVCKQLRYSLEFAQPLLGRSGERLIGALKTLQEQLGALNDAVVSQRLVADLTEQAEAVQEYGTAQQVQIEQVRGEAIGTFVDFVGPRTRRLLGAALAQV
jgi:triphosphatase